MAAAVHACRRSVASVPEPMITTSAMARNGHHHAILGAEPAMSAPLASLLTERDDAIQRGRRLAEERGCARSGRHP
jgi:hypothetical protein